MWGRMHCESIRPPLDASIYKSLKPQQCIVRKIIRKGLLLPDYPFSALLSPHPAR